MFDLCFRCGEGGFLRLDLSIDVVEGVGAVDPHDHTLAGCGGIFDHFDLQIGHVLGVVQVLTQISDYLLFAVLDLVLQKLVQ